MTTAGLLLATTVGLWWESSWVEVAAVVLLTTRAVPARVRRRT